MIKLCNCNFFDNGDDYKLRASRGLSVSTDAKAGGIDSSQL